MKAKLSIVVGICLLGLVVWLLTGCGVATPIPAPTPTPERVSDSMVVRGELITAKLFQTIATAEKPSTSKWLWSVKVNRVDANTDWSGMTPEPEDVITVDVEDSKANLFVESSPIKCEGVTGVNICDYNITNKRVVILVKVKTSNGQQEYYGVPQ